MKDKTSNARWTFKYVRGTKEENEKSNPQTIPEIIKRTMKPEAFPITFKPQSIKNEEIIIIEVNIKKILPIKLSLNLELKLSS